MTTTTMEKHYVDFFSPGTIFSEVSTREIDSWDVNAAMEMAKSISERHGAIPYAFKFTTKQSDGWNPVTVKRSGFYFLGGTLLTIDDIPDTKDNSVLRDNMKWNNYEFVIKNTNSWKTTLPFDKNNDTLLEWKV